MALQPRVVCFLLTCSLCALGRFVGCTKSDSANLEGAETSGSVVTEGRLVFRFALKADPANKAWEAARLVMPALLKKNWNADRRGAYRSCSTRPAS